MGGIARLHLNWLATVLVLLALVVPAAGMVSPVASAATSYGPGNSAWNAYYANPLDTATWAPFCAGVGAKYKAVAGVPVPACGPTGSTQINIPLSYPYTSGGETYTVGFQCVELVERYLYAAMQWGAIAGDGADMARLYGAAHGITPVANGAGKAPRVGDVISFSVEPDFTDDNNFYPGHTAIVTASSVNSSGNGSITILSQNWNGGANIMSLSVTNWTVPALQTRDGNGTLVSTPYVEWLPVGPPPPAVTGVAPPGGSSPNFHSAACASVRSCVAAGDDTASTYQPLLVTGSVASWKAVNPPLPGSGTNGSLNSVACPTATACTAVGWANAVGSFQPVVETPSGTSWVPTEPPLPANSSTPADASLTAVACASATSCTIAGNYENNVAEVPLLETGSGTNWAPHEPALPSNAQPGWGGQLASVACPPSGTACVAAGQYSNPASGWQGGLLETGSGMNWTPYQAPLPANAAADPSAQLNAVACPSATKCVIVGGYIDSSGNAEGLILTGILSTNWTWIPVEAPLPTGGTSGGLWSVACPSKAWCVAASYYGDSSGNSYPLLVTGIGTKWKPTEPSLPSDAQTPSTAQLHAVACHSATACLAVGTYRDSSGNYQGLLVNWSGTSWQPAKAPLPTDAGPPADLQRVSCPSVSACVAFGGSGPDTLIVTGL